MNFFSVCRQADIAQAGMSTLPVVEHFDVLADLSDRFRSRSMSLVTKQFLLERVEEALQWGVVPTVPLPIHGRNHLKLFYQLLIAAGTILAAPVGMVDQAKGWPLAATVRNRARPNRSCVLRWLLA